MKFPGKRKSEHYFPKKEKTRESQVRNVLETESYYIVGIDQLLVDIECRVPENFITENGLKKGESQVLSEEQTEHIYEMLKEGNYISGEYAGGSVGNTLHNYSVLADERSVMLGTIKKSITVGDYAFKYIRNTSVRVDLSYLQSIKGEMGRAMCFITPDGERSFAISKGGMNLLNEKNIRENSKIIENSSALLISAYLLRDEKEPIFKATIAACEIAMAAKVPVVFTLGTASLIASKKDFFRKFISDYVTIAAMNELEAAAITGIEDSLLSAEQLLDITDLILLTEGPKGLTIAGWVDAPLARHTTNALHTKSLVDYNEFEFSRPMRKDDCSEPIKIYTHINPFMGGPSEVKTTNGAGDAALAALLHDLSAKCYYQVRVPNSPKHNVNALTYSSLSQLAKYANRVSYEVITQKSPRLMRGLPEKETALEEAYWDK